MTTDEKTERANLEAEVERLSYALKCTQEALAAQVAQKEALQSSYEALTAAARDYREYHRPTYGPDTNRYSKALDAALSSAAPSAENGSQLPERVRQYHGLDEADNGSEDE